MKKTLIVVCILFVSSVMFTGCKKQSEESTPTPTETISVDANLAVNNLTTADPVTIDTITKQNYNLAKTKAQEWKSDAVLVSLSIKLPNDLAINSADETMIFGSSSDPNNWWSFSISEKTSRYIRAIIPKEDYLGTDVQPINLSYWKTNYAKAFQLAEANGGLAFRLVNPATTITETLHQTQPRGWLWWDVEYKAGNNRLLVKINPNNNDVVDESGNPLSSGSVATPISTPTTNTTTTY